MRTSIALQAGLVLFALSGVLVLLEAIPYFAWSRWYYLMGPVLHRERWQTRVSRDEALAALDAALPHAGLPGRRRGDAFCLRRAWTRWSAWPRFVLRVEEHEHGAVIVYEVSPFLSMSLALFAGALMFVGGFHPLWSLGLTLFIVAVYVGCWKWEIRLAGRLKGLRQGLAAIGLNVCDDCGYDLFAHTAGERCPECGKPAMR